MKSINPRLVSFFGAALAVAFIQWIFRYPPVDDAYITFRYSANLWNLGELVYNRFEMVLGTTTLLWAIVLSVPYGIGAHLEIIAPLISIFCWIGIAALFGYREVASGKLSPLPAVLWLFAFGLYTPVFLAAGSGMETLLYTLIVSGALMAAVSSRGATAGLLSGLSLWIRPDGLLCIAIAAWSCRNQRRQMALCTGIAGLYAIAYFSVNFSYYGSLLPHSVAAKQVLYPVPIVRNFFMVLEGFQQSPIDALLFCCGAAGFILNFRDPLVRSAGLWTALYIALLALSGVKPIFYWYFVPAWLLLLSVGMLQLAKLPYGDRFVAALSLLVVGFSVRQMSIVQPSIQREDTYRKIAVEYASSIKSSDRILLAETGILGFAFSESYICDSAGIISPQVTSIIAAMRTDTGGDQGRYGDISGFSGWLRRVIDTCKPTLIIGPRARMDLENSEHEEWFLRDYEKSGVYSEGLLGGIGVYRRMRSTE